MPYPTTGGKGTPGPVGPQGAPGKDGANGKDGRDGVDVPTGWYFQVNRLSGTSATIVSCFTQSMTA